MPARLPRLLQAAEQSRFATSEDSDPTTTVSGWQGCVLQSTCSPTQEARSLCLPAVRLERFPGSHDPLRELLVWEHVVFLPGLAAACQPLHKHSPVSRAPLSPQLGSLLGSGSATPQLGKQELVLPHQPVAV